MSTLATDTPGSVPAGDRVRNQIDYILISKQYRSAMLKVRTYPGADADSNYVPVVATFKLHLKKIKTTKQIPKFNFNSLEESDVRDKFRKAVMV